MSVDYTSDWFKENLVNKLVGYEIKHREYKNGDLGDLEQLEFNSSTYGGEVCIWSRGWLEVHLVNYQTGDELVNVKLSPGEQVEKEEAVGRLISVLFPAKGASPGTSFGRLQHMQLLINAINKKVAGLSYCELSMMYLQGNTLSIVGSEDILYFYNFEIRFIDVHTVVCNKEWKLDTSKQLIRILDNTPEELELNKRFRVIEGNIIFQLASDDDLVFYIIAGDLSFVDKTVKLY